MRRDRGFYFPAVLVVGALLAMVMTAALSVVTSEMRASRQLAGGDAAVKAADAGLRYVRARLGENFAWRGDGNAVIVDGVDLAVQEDNGNVVGVIRAEGGEFAQFRIRFNYQDDSAGDKEGLPDPGLWVDHQFVSINNAQGGGAAPVPRASGANSSVTNADVANAAYQVPVGTVCVLVEGRAGPALRDLDPTNLNPQLVAGRAVTTRVVEANLRVNAIVNTDAGAMAAGNINVNLKSKELKMEDASSAKTPKIRSKSEIVVNGGASPNLVADGGETYSASGNLTADYDPNKIENKKEDLNDGFYQLTWDDVKKATAADPTLSSGTYVLWDNGTLHYYDMDYAAYKTHIEANPTDPGQTANLPASMTLDTKDPKKPKLIIADNTYVKPTGNTDEFNLIPRSGAIEDPDGGGAGGSTYEEQRDNVIQNVLPPITPVYSSSPDHTQTWIVPLSAAVPGGFQEYYHPSGTGQGWGGALRLTDNGDGTGTLVLDDRDILDLWPPMNTNPVGALQAAMGIAKGNGSPEVQAIAAAISGGGGNQRIDLGGITDTLKPDNIEVKFEPLKGSSAILSSEGNIRIGSNIKGQGGSITSGGDIRIIGAGTDLSANIDDGLNLYAKGDIVLSSIKEKSDTEYEYKDFKMKGVIYAWGDFIAKVGVEDPEVTKWGKLEIQGALVAYGGDPAGNPGNKGNGKIDITANEVKLKFDPAYLVQINNNPPPGPMTQTFYAVYK